MRLSILGTILLLSILLIGCTTERKATNWMQNHPMVLTELCSLKFPPTVIYKQGEETTRTETVYQKGDSIPCPEDKNGKVKVIICPPNKTVTVVRVRVDTLETEGIGTKAKLALVLNDLEKANNEVEKQKEKTQKANNRFVWAVILGLVGITAARAFKF